MSVSLCIAYRVASRRAAQPACRSSIRCAAWSPSHLSSSSFSPPLLLVPLSSPSVGLATNSNPTSTVNPRPDALDSTQLLSRRPSKGLTEVESRGSVLDLYRKICRLLPQVLKAYELQGEDSYHRALRNLRFYFENHSQLKDSHVIEVLRHKAEMEIEEAMLMYKTKSHVAALFFGEPQLASAARHARQSRERPQLEGGQAQAGGQQQPSVFMQDFLAGTA